MARLTLLLDRLEWARYGPRDVLLDGAHNPHAAAALRTYVDDALMDGSRRRVRWFIGAMAKKDVEGIVAAVVKEGDVVCAVPVVSCPVWHTCAEPERIA